MYLKFCNQVSDSVDSVSFILDNIVTVFIFVMQLDSFLFHDALQCDGSSNVFTSSLGLRLVIIKEYLHSLIE